MRHTKPDETGKLSLICNSIRLTKPHEEGLWDKKYTYNANLI